MTAALVVGVSGCIEVSRTYSTAGTIAGVVEFRDDFGRTELGPDWLVTGGDVAIENGALRLERTRNHPVWLRRSLPDDIRIRFDAWSDSVDGDIKVEVAGDGHSFAREASYEASGYVVVFGGWKNTINVMARQDEHGLDRRTTRSPKVEPKKRYHFVITRKHGRLRWELDGKTILKYDDAKPLRGEGQDHFAFNDWETLVHFDNLVIEAI